jgi:hypothetical protein
VDERSNFHPSFQPSIDEIVKSLIRKQTQDPLSVSLATNYNLYGASESYLCGSMHGRTGEAGGMSTFETVRELCKVEMAKHGLVLDLSKDNYNTESLWRKETIYRRSSWSSRIDAR